MTNVMYELFKEALELDEELEMAIGTAEEPEAKREAKAIMDEIEAKGWRAEFDKYVEQFA